MNNNRDKTRAIVLTSVVINDRSQLVHFYTETQGRITCRVPLASRGKRAQQMRTLMAPMTLLDLELGGKPSDEIRQISEAQILQSPYLLTLEHPEKVSQCLYMAELLTHTVREEEPNVQLWQFITASLEVLEHCENGWANFHLVFTSGLTDLLGFSIDTTEYQEGCSFDLIEGMFTTQSILHPYYLNPESAKWFCRLLDTRYGTMQNLQVNRSERAALLDMQLAFLSRHIPEMGQLRSVEVLKSLFD